MSEFFDRGIKAKDQFTLEAALVSAGIILSTQMGTPEGVAYYFIGPIVTTPPTLNDDGSFKSPPIETVDVHANIRIFGENQTDFVSALLAAFSDTITPMLDDGAQVSYAMELRIPITCVWA